MTGNVRQATWWLQVFDADGMPAGGPVKVTPDSEAQIMAELQDLGLAVGRDLPLRR